MTIEKDNDLQLYTANEVADLLKVSRRTVYSYLSSGILKGVKIGKTIRITKQELQRLINGAEPETHQTTAAEPTTRQPATYKRRNQKTVQI